MPYQNNIPLANDQLSKSQGDINGNFQILGAIGGIPGINNSSGINTAPGAGFNYLYLSVGNNPPAGSVFANNNALYSSAVAGVNELFVNKNNLAGAVQIPFTKSILSNTAPVPGLKGWTYLPSGIIMKWGVIAVPNVIGGGTQAFDTTVPFTNIFSSTVGGQGAALGYTPTITAVNNVQITIVNKGFVAGTFQGAAVSYLIIGN